MGNIEIENYSQPLLKPSSHSQSIKSINSVKNREINMNKRVKEQDIYYDENNNKAFIDPHENIETVNMNKPRYITIDHFDSTNSLGKIDSKVSKSPYNAKKALEKKPSLKKKKTEKHLKSVEEIQESYYNNLLGENSEENREMLKLEMLQSQATENRDFSKKGSNNNLNKNDSKNQLKFEKERAAHKNLTNAQAQHLTNINKINSLGTLNKEMDKFLNKIDSTPSLNEKNYEDHSFSGSGKIKNLNDYYHENPVISPSGFIIDQGRSKTPRGGQPSKPTNEGGSYLKRFEKSASRNDISYDVPKKQNPNDVSGL